MRTWGKSEKGARRMRRHLRFSLKYEQEQPREGAFWAEGWAGAKARW